MASEETGIESTDEYSSSENLPGIISLLFRK
jgi:hypothetical protein